MQQLMRRCASIETCRQTKPRGKERRKAARRQPSFRQSDTDYANWTSVFNFIYGCLADSAEAHEVKIVILWWGFVILLRK